MTSLAREETTTSNILISCHPKKICSLINAMCSIVQSYMAVTTKKHKAPLPAHNINVCDTILKYTILYIDIYYTNQAVTTLS